MPIYRYQCPWCGRYVTVIRPIDDRDKPVECPDQCTPNCERIFESPTVFIGRAGENYDAINSRSDEYWERAERNKQKRVKKSEDGERERIYYNDKETHQKINNEVTNLRRMGNEGKAIEAELKVKEAK